MSHIFISHVEEDKAIALDVARGLEAAGYTTWYYERDSFPGPSYLLAVKEAIEKSRAVVLIVSPKAIGSHQMGIEFDGAFEIRKPFVPLLRGLNHVEFQHRQPKWAFALGTTTTIVVPAAGALPIVPNMTAGLKKLGILPLKQPTKVRLWDPVAAVGDVIKKRKIEQIVLSAFILLLLAALAILGYLNITRESSINHKEASRTPKEAKTLPPTSPLPPSEPTPTTPPSPPPKTAESPKPEAPAPPASPPVPQSPSAVPNAPQMPTEVPVTTPRDVTGKPGEFCKEECFVPYQRPKNAAFVFRMDWSPDAKTVLFNICGGQNYHGDCMFALDMEAKSISSWFLQGIWAPAYSPDGGTVAASCAGCGRGIVMVNVASRTQREWLPGSGWLPAFTHDGRRMCYVSWAASNQWQVWIANVDGTDRQPLTDSSHSAHYPDASPVEPIMAYYNFTYKRGNTPDQRGTGITVQRLDGEKETLAETNIGESPKWSPDGQMIAFYHASNIWVMDKTAGARLQVTKETKIYGGGGTGSYCWSPDGTKMIYYLEEPNRPGFKIVSLDLKGIRQRLGISSPTSGGSRSEAAPGLSSKMSITLEGGVKMDFVLIPAGSFMMGSERGTMEERPVHEVKITKPYYMGVYEVTQAQWKALMGDKPAHFRGDDLPVEKVSWEDCQRFLAKLKEKAGEGMTCRLPTEAEWEYACRAGSKTDYCFGNDAGSLREYAWFDGNSESKTNPGGQKKPNAWGLYDMHGNVWEWCADWRGDYSASAATDPTGPASGIVRVLRGGSWGDDARRCRAPNRLREAPSYRGNNDGFRVACAVAVGR